MLPLMIHSSEIILNQKIFSPYLLHTHKHMHAHRCLSRNYEKEENYKVYIFYYREIAK